MRGDGPAKETGQGNREEALLYLVESSAFLALYRRGALGKAEYEACMLRLFRLHPAPHGPPEGIDTEYAKGGA